MLFRSPSTVEVYGNARGEDVFTEDYTGRLNLATARSCYSESKRVSEALCQSYIAERGAKVKIVRLSRIFGPTMLMSDTKASSQFIIKALNGEDIVLKSEGKQYFSYTYVADAVSAMLYVLLHGENGVAYNISNEACNVRLKEFASLCAEWAGKKVVDPGRERALLSHLRRRRPPRCGSGSGSGAPPRRKSARKIFTKNLSYRN